MPNIVVTVDGTTVFSSVAEPLHVIADTVIARAEDALPFFEPIRAATQESFLVVSLNAANRVLASRIVTTGTLDQNMVHPREVFADPLMDRASGILVGHNHPSGTLTASPEDIAITFRLQRAGELLGIRVIDHIIVTEAGFISMKSLGHL